MPTLLCTVRSCREPLTLDERGARCMRGHAFDRARSGYLNLLHPQDRRSATPGDTAEAVAARSRFTARGFGASITAAIVRIATQHSPATALDAGCGDGHHLGAIRAAATDCEAIGVDISVPAIDTAARRHPDCFFVVANADRFLPFADASFDLVLSITARLNPSEFRRVVDPRGHLLVFVPAADDLIELRGVALGEEREVDRVARTAALFDDAFVLSGHERLAERVPLDREAISDVMTSSYRAMRARERERLSALDSIDATLSRDALLFRPKSDHSGRT